MRGKAGSESGGWARAERTPRHHKTSNWKNTEGRNQAPDRAAQVYDSKGESTTHTAPSYTTRVSGTNTPKNSIKADQPSNTRNRVPTVRPRVALLVGIGAAMPVDSKSPAKQKAWRGDGNQASQPASQPASQQSTSDEVPEHENLPAAYLELPKARQKPPNDAAPEQEYIPPSILKSS